MTLPRYTQENVLALLAFDDANCAIARNALTRDLFDYPYVLIFDKCASYIDKYKCAPKDHLGDELDKELKAEKSEQIREIFQGLHVLRANLNSKYVLDSLVNFICDRRFEQALYDAAELQAKGKRGEAQEAVRQSLNVNLNLFDPGIRITDLSLLEKGLQEEEIFPTGIQALDVMKVGPAAGQLLMFLGTRSSGKSWFCIQCARMAVMMGFKVVHISLEISAAIVQQRYIQSLLGMTRWEYEIVKSPIFIRDGNNDVIRIDQEIITPRSLDDPDRIAFIRSRLKANGPKFENGLRVRAWPSGYLTISELRAYLDGLERTENFIPNMLILDMPMNMKFAVKDFRLSLDRTMIELRGLAVERNMAVIAPHQINRIGSQAKFITGEHISEDWGILGTADTAFVYNRKPGEERFKLARLYVDRGRSMRSRMTVMLAQNYDCGQFCLDSAKMPPTYNPDSVISSLASEQPEVTS